MHLEISSNSIIVHILGLRYIFLNHMNFLTSVSEHAHYSTAGAVNNLKFPSLEAGLKKAIWSYDSRGFRMIMISASPKFKTLKHLSLVGVPFN